MGHRGGSAEMFSVCVSVCVWALVALSAAQLSEDDQQVLVEQHNLRRTEVQPTAHYMRKMSWDESLRIMAEGYAAKCIWDHNPEMGDKGENLYITSGSLDPTVAVEKWFLEHEYYNYTSDECQEGQMCGHYTQVVWADSYKVGCASHFCEEIEGLDFDKATILVCNYFPAGNYDGVKPYIEGEFCSQCPADMPRCEDSLCAPEEVPSEEGEQPESVATDAPGGEETPAEEDTPLEEDTPTEEETSPDEPTDANPAEVETPSEETEAPPEDTQAPPEHTQAPPEDTESPPEDTDAPPEGSDAPPEGSDALPHGSDAPSQDSDPAPAEEEATPPEDPQPEESATPEPPSSIPLPEEGTPSLPSPEDTPSPAEEHSEPQDTPNPPEGTPSSDPTSPAEPEDISPEDNPSSEPSPDSISEPDPSTVSDPSPIPTAEDTAPVNTPSSNPSLVTEEKEEGGQGSVQVGGLGPVQVGGLGPVQVGGLGPEDGGLEGLSPRAAGGGEVQVTGVHNLGEVSLKDILGEVIWEGNIHLLEVTVVKDPQQKEVAVVEEGSQPKEAIALAEDTHPEGEVEGDSHPKGVSAGDGDSEFKVVSVSGEEGGDVGVPVHEVIIAEGDLRVLNERVILEADGANTQAPHVIRGRINIVRKAEIPIVIISGAGRWVWSGMLLLIGLMACLLA